MIVDVTLLPLEAPELPFALDLLASCELPSVGVHESVEGFVVARVAGDVVGCCGIEVHGTDALLRSLAVVPTWRGRGVAASLVANRIALAERRGLSALYLLTTTAREYFTRFGFDTWPRDRAPEAIRDSWEFRAGCPDTATFMRRALNGSASDAQGR